jgi:hypothetical protein
MLLLVLYMFRPVAAIIKYIEPLESAFFLKSTIFWHITPCSPLKDIRRFGGTYHLQARLAISFHSGILLGLFDAEYGGDMFLRNVGLLSTGYAAVCPSG